MPIVKKGKILALKIKILLGRHFGSASIKAAYAKNAGINIERIPKDRENSRTGKAGKNPNPNNVEISDKVMNMLQSPKTIAEPIAIVRILKRFSVVNLRLKLAKNDNDYTPFL